MSHIRPAEHWFPGCERKSDFRHPKETSEKETQKTKTL